MPIKKLTYPQMQTVREGITSFVNEKKNLPTTIRN